MKTLHKAVAGIVMAVAASSVTAHAGSSPAYNFLNLPTSTNAYGLGGLNISNIDDNDPASVWSNPALLGPEMGKAISVNYMHYLGGSNFAGAQWTMPAGEHSAWAVGLQYFGYGSMKLTDETGMQLGDFSPKDLAVSGYYSRDINEAWRGGVAIKFLYSSYESYSAIALATDIGVNYYNADRDFSFSAMVANLGGQVKRFTDKYDRLPIDVRLGVTKGFGSFRFNVTAWNLTKWKLPYYAPGDGTSDEKPELKNNFGSNLFRHLIFAVDFVPSDRFHIGLGYNYKTRTDMSTYSRNFLSGFTLGAGLNIRSLGVGVAVAQPHSGAMTVMLNVSFAFSDLIR